MPVLTCIKCGRDLESIDPIAHFALHGITDSKEVALMMKKAHAFKALVLAKANVSDDEMKSQMVKLTKEQIRKGGENLRKSGRTTGFTFCNHPGK